MRGSRPTIGKSYVVQLGELLVIQPLVVLLKLLFRQVQWSLFSLVDLVVQSKETFKVVILSE